MLYAHSYLTFKTISPLTQTMERKNRIRYFIALTSVTLLCPIDAGSWLLYSLRTLLLVVWLHSILCSGSNRDISGDFWMTDASWQRTFISRSLRGDAWLSNSLHVSSKGAGYILLFIEHSMFSYLVPSSLSTPFLPLSRYVAKLIHEKQKHNEISYIVASWEQVLETMTSANTNNSRHLKMFF